MAANSATTLTGTAGSAVTPSPSVIVRDQNGNPFPGATVTFAVQSGGGSISAASAVTNSTGVASVDWTLGKSVGANVLTASSGSLSTVTFNATGDAGPASGLAISAGNNQVGTAGSAVPIAPAVIVQDPNGNPKAGVAVTFTVASGGGSVTGGAATTNSAGIAAVGSWILGKTVGANVLTATSGGLSATFNATGNAGPVAALIIAAGNNQVANGGTVLPISPAVIVQDANGNLKPGIAVTFAIGSGGGSVTGASATSNAAGIASVGSWTLGAAAGTNTLIASSAGVPSVTFTATAVSPKCSVRLTHVLGTTSSGTLDPDDCQFSDGSFVDFYSTTVAQAGAYFFRQTSSAFNPYLVLAFPDGSGIAENDDETENTQSAGIKALLPAGNYVLGPGSFEPNKTGAYSLSSSVAPTNNTNCELLFVIKGVTSTQAIETTDCLIQTNPIVYSDAYFILLKAGQSVTVSMSSTTVDSFIQLVRQDGLVLAQNDNRDATTKDAQVSFTAPATDYYVVFTRTALSAQTGAYTINFQ